MTDREINDFFLGVLREEYDFDPERSTIGFRMPVTYPDGSPLELGYYEEGGEYYLTDGGSLCRFLRSSVAHLDSEIADTFVAEMIAELDGLYVMNVKPECASCCIGRPDNAWTIRDGINSFRQGFERFMTYIYREYMSAPRYDPTRACYLSLYEGVGRLHSFCDRQSFDAEDSSATRDLLVYLIGIMPSLDRRRAIFLVRDLQEQLSAQEHPALEVTSELKRQLETLSDLEYEVISRFYLKKRGE